MKRRRPKRSGSGVSIEAMAKGVPAIYMEEPGVTGSDDLRDPALKATDAESYFGSGVGNFTVKYDQSGRFNTLTGASR